MFHKAHPVFFITITGSLQKSIVFVWYLVPCNKRIWRLIQKIYYVISHVGIPFSLICFENLWILQRYLICFARVFYPCFQGFVEGRSLLVVFGFCFFPTPPSGPPWNEGHWPRVRHETSVLEVLAPGTTRTLLLFKFY